MNQYITIDIGGTSIKHGLVSDGRLLESGETPTNASEGGAAVLERAAGLCETYLGGSSAAGICVSTAGMVDDEAGTIVWADPLIPEYAGTRIRQTLEDRFGLPCAVENDVNCMGLCEYYDGAARGADAAVCMTVGTGIGGCVLLGGEVLHGHAFGAGEIGHMHIPGGQFQRLGAASVLVKAVERRKGLPEGTLNGRIIFDDARAGDAVCREEIARMTDVLACGIANVCYIVNPGVVVLGGGIMAERDMLAPLLEEALAKYLPPYLAQRTSLKFAEHKNNAGMLGAYYNFIQKNHAG